MPRTKVYPAKENKPPHEKRMTQQEVASLNPFCTLPIVYLLSPTKTDRDKKQKF